MRNINSLRKGSLFKEVYKKGKSRANTYLVMYVLPAEGETKIGLSVSKKVGNSVVRHRIARLLRECYLTYKEDLPQGYHLVVVARYTCKGAGLSELKEAFGQLLNMHRLVTGRNS